MRCPYCHSTNNKVIDSRPSREANAIRRRRECLHCQRRFTTYEQVEETMPLVVKKDGRREPFQRSKLYEGITKACEKRPVSIDAIENFLDSLEREMLESGQREIASTWIGERVMAQLRQWDEVAYVRFASVYRHFTDATDFMEEIRHLLATRKEEKERRRNDLRGGPGKTVVSGQWSECIDRRNNATLDCWQLLAACPLDVPSMGVHLCSRP